MTFSLLITDAPGTGLYAWELRDQGQVAQGVAPTINRCLTAIAQARLDFDHHRHPETGRPSHEPLNPAPIPHVHPPHGHALPAQQHIPSPAHPCPATP